MTLWLYPFPSKPPYPYHPLHNSWQASITLEGRQQGMELLLAAGDRSPTTDKGILDWFRDSEKFDDANLERNFCTETVNYAEAHNFSLARPANETIRSLKWQTDEQEEDFGSQFAGLVSWFKFLHVENFTGITLPQHKPNVPALSAVHNPLHTIPHRNTAVAILYTTLYDMCQQPSMEWAPSRRVDV